MSRRSQYNWPWSLLGGHRTLRRTTSGAITKYQAAAKFSLMVKSDLQRIKSDEIPMDLPFTTAAMILLDPTLSFSHQWRILRPGGIYSINLPQSRCEDRVSDWLSISEWISIRGFNRIIMDLQRRLGDRGRISFPCQSGVPTNGVLWEDDCG
ncbi:unnamed protein product [Arabis nemorensis]|uniref:Methyltransferase n=1 Tax=Arabis nemorensis TaxID=586526 RepID=A0A565C5E7_9BRAS|nr:unnamed protein product [Arabis nemorensis]